MKVHLITEKIVSDAVKSGLGELAVTLQTLITPLARDRARDLGLSFVITSALIPKPSLKSEGRTVALGSDHSGFAAKTELVQFLAAQGFGILDVGTDSDKSCDYPDFAFKVGEAVMTGQASFGIMIDGVGTASAVVLNKMPFVRAVSCCNEFTAKIARAHGDANVLTLGARTQGIEILKSLSHLFLTTAFEAGRHTARLEKIRAIEQKFLKPR